MAESVTRQRPALEFRAGDSLIHRTGPGAKLLVATVVGALALAFASPLPLAGLSLAVVCGYAAARLGFADLWKDARWLLLQGAIVVALTLVLRGGGALGSGLRTALQLVLVFMPIALVLRTTSTDALLDRSQRWMPERIRFAASATFRFVPFFSRELAELTEMQRLRGARLNARDLWYPDAWRDWLSCVVVPIAVRVIEVAEEAADAAMIRGIGNMDEEDRR